jgi:C1A family cysteine protease
MNGILEFSSRRDQGNLGSCTANALCAAFAYESAGFEGSRLFLYYNERVLEKDVAQDAGAFLSDGIKCLEKYGVCPETEWSYFISKFATKPTPTCYTDALKHVAVTASNIQNTLAAMRQSLFLGLPFVVGIAVYDSFESEAVARTGLVPMPNTNTEQLLGGHAVLVCGYDDKKKLFIVRNSWGVSWGNKGYFYLPYAYLTNSSLSSDLWNISVTKNIQ